MPVDSQSYLLALDVFAIIAMFMAVSAAPGRTRQARNRLLLALILLAVVRSVALLAFLLPGNQFPQLPGSVEVLSLFCIIWALARPSVYSSQLWRLYAWAGLVITAIFIFALWQAPDLPWQRLALIVGLGGLPLVFFRQDQARWGHVAAPLILTLAFLLNWLGLAGAGQFIALIAYGALIYAVFTETAINARLQQQTAESLGLETHRINAERLRFIEASSILSAAHNPGEALKHAVRSIAKFTHCDQVIMLAFVETEVGAGYIAAAYSSDDTVRHTSRDNTGFSLTSAPLVLDVLETRRHIIAAKPDETPALNSLYALWQETRVGPTILQPLVLQQKIVGILVVGNPISQRPLPATDIRLAQSLAPQLASLVVYQRHHHTLETQTEDFAAKLQLSQAELRQQLDIIETISDGVIVSNVEGKIQLVNSVAQRLLGKSRQQLLGKPIGVIYGNIATDESSIEKLATEFSRSNQALPTFFERDGIAVQGRLIPLRNNRQEWTGIVVLLRDVTAEVDADKAKTEFVQTISRELRTPLTTTGGYIDLLLTGAAGQLDVQQRHFMSIIKAGLDRVTAIVNNATLSIERATNTIKLDLQPINANALISAAIRAASPLAAARQLRLNTDISPQLPAIQADQARLRQVLDNLLANACHVTSPGGQVLLRAWGQSEGLNGQQSEYLIVSVSDNGRGLSMEAQRHIFDQNYLLSDEPKQTPEGQNLVMVKEVVGAHGGRVWVESVEGKGSVFHIALPSIAGK